VCSSDLVRRFLDEPDASLKLRSEIAGGDIRAALITVHSLKGVAGALGAAALKRACESAEAQLRSGIAGRPDLPAMLDGLATLYVSARAVLEDAIAGPVAAAAPVPAPELQRLAADLDRLLRARDDASFDAFDRLLEALGETGRQRLQAVARPMTRDDFDGAAQALEALLRESPALA
jgi:HPt (histidine-containing phosphotransfer) domain-containing protein